MGDTLSFGGDDSTEHVFRAWSLDGTWAALNDALRVCLRRDEGRHNQPNAAILDSQSVIFWWTRWN